MSETPNFMTHERIMTGEEYVSYSDYLSLERERDEAMDAMETCRRVSRKDCEQNAKRAEELHVQNLTLERERDEALEELIHLRSCVYDVIHTLKSGAFDELEKAWKEGLK